MTGVNPTVTRVATSTTVANVLTAANRHGFIVVNESAAILYLKFGAGASATDYSVQIAAGEDYHSPMGLSHVGIVSAVLAAGAGFAQVTSLA